MSETFKQETCAGVIPICPVCARGVNRTADTEHLSLSGVFFHRACFRFAGLFTPAERCPICQDNSAVQEGDIPSGRWWLACTTCRLPVSRWSNFPIKEHCNVINCKTPESHNSVEHFNDFLL